MCFPQAKFINLQKKSDDFVIYLYCNLDAATPIRCTTLSCKRQKYYARSRGAKQPWRSHYNAFCSITWQTRISLRTWQQNVTPLMQPLHCDLQPRMQQAHRSTHTWTTTRCKTPRENRFDDETSAAAPAAHTRYLSSPADATLHGKTHSFVLRLPPQNKRQVSRHSSCVSFLWNIVIWCTVLWRKVSHHSTLRSLLLCDVLLCDVKSHTTLRWCIVMWCIVMWCVVMWCKVTWIKVIRISEDCFPTSFDDMCLYIYNVYIYICLQYITRA